LPPSTYRFTSSNPNLGSIDVNSDEQGIIDIDLTDRNVTLQVIPSDLNDPSEVIQILNEFVDRDN